MPHDNADDRRDLDARARVLAIDDSPLVLEALRLAFAEGELATAESVKDGLAALAADPGLRVILLDLSIPGGGVPLIRRLRDEFPDRIVIVLSGDAGAIASAARELGVFRCLEKGDASLDQLAAVVDEARAALAKR